MRSFYFIFIPLAVIGLFLILLPLAGMFFKTSPEELLLLFSDREVIFSILLTFESAFYATLFALLFGTPAAYMLARYDFPGKKIIEALVDIPIMVPHTAAGIALFVVFGTGVLGNFFKSIGIEFIGTKAGIVLGMAFVSVPFYIDSVKDGFASVEKKIEYAARSLGANRIQVFFRIMLPLAMRSLFTGSILMWGRGISEFGAVVILTYHPMTAPILIFDRFTSFGLKSSRPIAVLLIILCIVVFVLFKTLSNFGARVNAEDR